MQKKYFYTIIFLGVLFVCVGYLFLLRFDAKINRFVSLNGINNNIFASFLTFQAPKQEQPVKPSFSFCDLSAISAQSFLVQYLNANGKKQTILERESNKKLPIASLTKLMTYVIVKEFYGNNKNIKIVFPPSSSNLNTTTFEGEQTRDINDLIAMMLVESNNEAASALSEPMSEQGFVSLMNLKAQQLGLQETYFYNPTGLDPQTTGLPDEKINYSTAKDIARLTEYLLFHYPDFWRISSQKEYVWRESNGKLYFFKNTNLLLEDASLQIIGGKTGTTERAGECLMTVSRGKNTNDFFILVILNSQSRFADAKILLQCAKENELVLNNEDAK